MAGEDGSEVSVDLCTPFSSIQVLLIVGCVADPGRIDIRLIFGMTVEGGKGFLLITEGAVVSTTKGLTGSRILEKGLCKEAIRKMWWRITVVKEVL